jgi:hypothetical protein
MTERRRATSASHANYHDLVAAIALVNLAMCCICSSMPRDSSTIGFLNSDCCGLVSLLWNDVECVFLPLLVFDRVKM